MWKVAFTIIYLFNCSLAVLLGVALANVTADWWFHRRFPHWRYLRIVIPLILGIGVLTVFNGLIADYVL